MGLGPWPWSGSRASWWDSFNPANSNAKNDKAIHRLHRFPYGFKQSVSSVDGFLLRIASLVVFRDNPCGVLRMFLEKRRCRRYAENRGLRVLNSRDATPTAIH